MDDQDWLGAVTMAVLLLTAVIVWAAEETGPAWLWTTVGLLVSVTVVLMAFRSSTRAKRGLVAVVLLASVRSATVGRRVWSGTTADILNRWWRLRNAVDRAADTPNYGTVSALEREVARFREAVSRLDAASQSPEETDAASGVRDDLRQWQDALATAGIDAAQGASASVLSERLGKLEPAALTEAVTAILLQRVEASAAAKFDSLAGRVLLVVPVPAVAISGAALATVLSSFAAVYRLFLGVFIAAVVGFYGKRLRR